MYSKKSSHEYGATLVEYAILIALIAVVTISSLEYLSIRILCTFSTIERGMTPGRDLPTMVELAPGDYRSCT